MATKLSLKPYHGRSHASLQVRKLLTKLHWPSLTSSQTTSGMQKRCFHWRLLHWNMASFGCSLSINQQTFWSWPYSQRKLFQTPTEIMDVLKVLIFPKDNPQPLFYGATKAAYKIVSIPIWEEWNEQLHKKYEVSKSKMPWYVVQNFGNIAGYKEEWHFKKKPMVVVLNHQGMQHSNAFHLIQANGTMTFLFTMQSSVDYIIAAKYKERDSNRNKKKKEDYRHKKKSEDYIFYYGGRDKEWIQQFEKHATALANDAIIKEAHISIKLQLMDTGLGRNLWVAKEVKTVMHCCKNETGWALLMTKNSVVVCGHGTTILKTVAGFEKWKKDVIEKGFEFSIQEYHERYGK